MQGQMDDGYKELLRTINERLASIERKLDHTIEIQAAQGRDITGLKVKAGVAGGIVGFLASIVVGLLGLKIR